MDTAHAALEERRDQSTGQFGPHDRRPAEKNLLTSPATFSIPVDEVNSGDTLLIDGKPHLVHDTWVLGIEPETRIVETDRGDIRLDREERADVIRTGDEPDPEDHDDFAGYCHSCGEPFAETPEHVTFHIHPRGGYDYDADRDHTPYSLDDMNEIVAQFGEDEVL